MVVPVLKPKHDVDNTTILPRVISGSSGSNHIGYIISHIIHGYLIFYVCIKSAIQFEDSTKAMAFYGVYHRETLNQVIHFFGVPFILLTTLIYAAHLPFTNKIVIDFLPGIQPHYISWSIIWMMLYNVFYISIDPIGALLFAPGLYYMYKIAIDVTAYDQRKYYEKNKTLHWMGTGNILFIALVLHVLSWFLQIRIGHTVIEGAKPASLANLGGALTTAPLFAFYEGVWFVGFRKQFQQQVLDQVAVYTQELCTQGADMRVCSTL